jgi:glycosyltransferase involved in cell wall biosynthesis
MLASLGHETQILFGPEKKPGPDNLLNQIMLLDQQMGRVGRFTRVYRCLKLFAPRAREIVMTGDVITTEFSSRFPPADRFWASHDIFRSANALYRALPRFTPLQLGDKVETDIMHWTAPLPLFEPRIANVYTLHDLIPLRLPYTTLDNKRRFYAMCKTIAKRADRIFTVSEHSRQDIIRLLHVPEDRVVNTYQAVDMPRRFLERTEADVAHALSGFFGLEPRSYFLYFGALEPKKNLGRIVEAYLSSDTKSSLIIVGREWLDERRKKLFQKRGIETNMIPQDFLTQSDRIKQFQYLPFSSLVTLIQGARAVLFPSLYEGFGLPVMEAMQLGTPVLTSSAGSLPEVAGDAAILVDPYDVEAIKRAIQALDADADLRGDLIEKGHRRAALFSTERYRQRLQEAYAPLL